MLRYRHADAGETMTMEVDRREQTARPAIKQRPAIPATVQRAAATAAPSPGRALQGRLGNHGTQLLAREVLRSPTVVSRKGGGDSPSKPSVPPVTAKAPPPQALLIEPTPGPNATDCGGYGWTISFLLARDSVAGGHIIQHVRVDYDMRNFLGWDVTSAYVRKKHWDFWEAWRVNAGEGTARMIQPPAAPPRTKGGKPGPAFAVPYSAGNDLYADPDNGIGTKGTIVVTGEARFYEGAVTLPPDFKFNHPDTLAGSMPSTTKDPNLPGGTPKVDHNLSVAWDCVFSKSKTKIVSHTP